MSNTVILKKSSVAGKIPISSDLQPAELAVNLVDQKLYSKRTDGTVVLVGVGASIIDPTVNRFSGTGSQTAFTLSAAPVSAKALIVNISGVVQTPDVDFTVGGTTLTFTTAPPAGTYNITVQNLGTVGTINVPADGSVTAVKMAAGAAVGNLGFTPYNATNPSGYITSSASITGNAATATKLQTARTLTIGSTGKTFDGSDNVAWSLAEMGAQPASTAITTSNIGSQSVSYASSAGNADTLDGQHGSYYQPASSAITTSNIGSQSVNYATSASSCSGNSATATKLANDSGSAPSYSCRAWVNFNGTGTVAIRASGNVSSIVDNGTGDYTINFTTAMPDTNYSLSGFIRSDLNTPNNVHSLTAGASETKTTSAVRVLSRFTTGLVDTTEIDVQIFR